jgi:hypothetical protein
VRKSLAMIAAYCATAMVIPLLFVGMTFVWPVPLAGGLYFASILQAYFVVTLMAFVAGLPGFAIGRLCLWRTGSMSPLAFVFAGAAAGYIAAVVLCLPDHLWVLRRYGVDFFGAGIGALAGLVYRQAERILTRTRPTNSDLPEFGDVSR